MKWMVLEIFSGVDFYTEETFLHLMPHDPEIVYCFEKGTGYQNALICSIKSIQTIDTSQPGGLLELWAINQHIIARDNIRRENIVAMREKNDEFKDAEITKIEAAMEKADGCQKKAADILRMTPRMLNYKLQIYELKKWLPRISLRETKLLQITK